MKPKTRLVYEGDPEFKEAQELLDKILPIFSSYKSNTVVNLCMQLCCKTAVLNDISETDFCEFVRGAYKVCVEDFNLRTDELAKKDQ